MLNLQAKIVFGNIKAGVDVLVEIDESRSWLD